MTQGFKFSLIFMKNGVYIYSNQGSVHNRTVHRGGVVTGNWSSVDYSEVCVERLMRIPTAPWRKTQNISVLLFLSWCWKFIITVLFWWKKGASTQTITENCRYVRFKIVKKRMVRWYCCFILWKNVWSILSSAGRNASPIKLSVRPHLTTVTKSKCMFCTRVRAIVCSWRCNMQIKNISATQHAQWVPHISPNFKISVDVYWNNCSYLLKSKQEDLRAIRARGEAGL